MRNREQPSLEEALKYIEDFGGFEKAMLRNNLSKWLEYKDWSYHNECVQIYADWFLDELHEQQQVESPTVDEFIMGFNLKELL